MTQEFLTMTTKQPLNHFSTPLRTYLNNKNLSWSQLRRLCTCSTFHVGRGTGNEWKCRQRWRIWEDNVCPRVGVVMIGAGMWDWIEIANCFVTEMDGWTESNLMVSFAFHVLREKMEKTEEVLLYGRFGLGSCIMLINYFRSMYLPFR